MKRSSLSGAGRARKLADRIREIIATTLDRGVKDPRLGFVTITDVRVTNDLQHASVFYTVYGDATERENTAAALKSATGMLRSEVGRGITARLTPTLEFILDAVPENADHIASLLNEAAARDADLKNQSQHASFAGEEQPYRKADDTDE